MSVYTNNGTDRVDVAYNVKHYLVPVDSDFAASFWWKGSSLPNLNAQYQVLLQLNDTSGNKLSTLLYNNGGTNLLLTMTRDVTWAATGYMYSVFTPLEDTWYNIVLNYGANNACEIYINTSSQSVSYVTWTDNTAIDPDLFGLAGDGSAGAQGDMNVAHFAIWADHLTQDEISQLYTSPRWCMSHPDLVSYFPMNEGSGSTANDHSESNDQVRTDGTLAGSSVTFMDDDPPTITLMGSVLAMSGYPLTPISLTVQALLSSGTIDNVSLTQANTLAVQSLLSAGVIDNVTLEVVTMLVVQSLNSAGLLDNVSLTQANTLVIQSLLSAGTIDNTTLEVVAMLVVQSLNSAGLLDNVSLTQANTLVVQALHSAGTIDNVTLSIATLLVVQALLSSGTIDNVSLTQAHNLTVQALLSTGTIDNTVLTQAHTLAVQALHSAGTIDNITLSLAILLVVQSLNSAGLLDNTSLTQAHNLTVHALNSVGLLDNVSLTQANTLIVQALHSAGLLDNISLDTGIAVFTDAQYAEIRRIHRNAMIVDGYY